MEFYPRADWDPNYQAGTADSEGSDHDATPTREDASQAACGGARCLERAAAGMGRPAGRSGPTGPRCPRCRRTELEDETTNALQNLLDSDTYQEHITGLRQTRPPSHIEVGALLIQTGQAPASVTRICKALCRLGVAHSEDLEEREPAAQAHPSRLPPGACPGCRGRHRRHTLDHRCRLGADAPTQQQGPDSHVTMQPRRYRTPRRPNLADAGPYFHPCPSAARTPDAATTSARQAMLQLASRSTPYPAAQAPPPAHLDTGRRLERTTDTHRIHNAPPTDTSPPTPAANIATTPTTADQLRAALAAFHQNQTSGQCTTHALTAG